MQVVAVTVGAGEQLKMTGYEQVTGQILAQYPSDPSFEARLLFKVRDGGPKSFGSSFMSNALRKLRGLAQHSVTDSKWGDYAK